MSVNLFNRMRLAAFLTILTFIPGWFLSPIDCSAEKPRSYSEVVVGVKKSKKSKQIKQLSKVTSSKKRQDLSSRNNDVGRREKVAVVGSGEGIDREVEEESQESAITPVQMSSEEVRAKLDELRSSILRREAEFSEVAARVDKVDKDLRRQSEELGTLSEQQVALEEALEISKKQALEVAKRREQSKKVISGVGDRFRVRLRAMERRSRSSMQLPINPEGGQIMFKDLLYFRRIADSDLRLLERITKARNDLERMERHLVQLKQHQEQAERGISERVSSKKVLVEHRKQLLLEEKERKATLKKVLASLKSKAREMEGVLRSLTAGVINEEEMPREWFAGLRPPLPVPVEGQLIQGFGKKKLRGLQDLIFSKGLEFSAPVGSGVKVISTGIVRFIGELPGYGVTIMVEHGQRFFSLYGRLKGIEVSKGDTVMQGTQLGSTGELDFEGRNFYFEIREKGEALDPKRFISLLGDRGVRAGDSGRG